MSDGVGLLATRLGEILVEPGQQSELARKLGEKRQRVNNWVRGKADVPADEVPRIADALGVTICELYGRPEGHAWSSEKISIAERFVRRFSGELTDAEVAFLEAMADVLAQYRERLRSEEGLV